MHPDSVSKLNGIGMMFRFFTPLLGIMASVISGLVLMYLGGLKTDLLQAKIEARVNFDKLSATAQINFDKIDTQLNNHLAHHQQFDKEIFERLSVIETKVKGK